MSNLDTWNKHADIDPRFTKPITGKAYKGTSPSPQHVIWCLTDLFGPVGQGFGWDVAAEGFMPMGDEVLHWCRIRFWHTDRANSFDAYGQTKALMKTRNGMMLDEDAPKKSLTDAIVKAASQIGIAANIFLGRWDDQKYVADVGRGFRDEEPQSVALARESTAPAFNARATADRIIAKLRAQATIEELASAWKDETAARKAVFEADEKMHAQIAAAKDARKTALELGDEIPF